MFGRFYKLMMTWALLKLSPHHPMMVMAMSVPSRILFATTSHDRCWTVPPRGLSHTCSAVSASQASAQLAHGGASPISKLCSANRGWGREDFHPPIGKSGPGDGTPVPVPGQIRVGGDASGVGSGIGVSAAAPGSGHGTGG
jgi:hypothetical protein